MTHFSKKTISAILFAALLSACGDQSTTDSATTSSVQKTAQISQAAPILSPASSNDLLASLAVAYPNGQIPATSAAQAAKELAQNPAVLHVTAANAATAQNAKSASLQPQAVAADYKAVTRIQNTTLTGAYFFTIYDAERTTALANNPNWKLEGAAFWASLASGTGLNSVHRFRNNLNGSYLYTIYEAEKTEIETNYASTFTYEGVAWYAQQTPGAGWSPLYRFRNLLNGTYLFSAYEAEKDAIVANYSAVFKLEGIAYYVRQDAPTYELVSNANGGFYDKTECVRDARTGLIWQGQTPVGTGLRANNNYKTNYDSTMTAQKYNTMSGTYVIPTQTEVDATTNSVGFINAINATNLCGSVAWRLPTLAELSGILKQSETPKIDNLWFPNTSANDFYWTSSPDTLNGFGYAKGLGFGNGGIYSSLRSSLGSNPLVRLVQ
jgi:Protein of unknown function (DUF1566)/Repeat of unknown function (DUF5648)